MVGRRETRHEAETFMAKLEGMSVAERHRLLKEHRAYLTGERATDAQMSGPARVLRPVRPPPLGQSAAYIAALKNRGEYEDSEGNEADEEEWEWEKSKGKKGRAKGKRSVHVAKKPTNSKKKASESENKKDLEAAAVARAVSAATKKKLAHRKERLRLEKEE
ncbi:unnamed protein product [Phytophthora fragariaefolia]|uniref:Unnamed protein product n=1 Tax=Phytophthora fragariaefolia TaxID=1490495 RepID=A0A9W6TQL6_9STRA|nr:unnamed protein product [Phytophthora fragariaefolia]